ncbi:MAG TPA: D-alanine--D-alanine ligase [Thermoanaerobaculia bacterium]|nr:D-alanine--D-alanine ligase [Thermoanaerobaculia bacterium]
MIAPAFPEVTVLTGDPRLPDLTKVHHRFSAEDLDSLGRMRQALETLPDYRFTYLDDHHQLLPRLSGDPPPFVLNFCDTGYRNEARHELHVAALLEMLDIPFSGSGPTCLGLCFDKGLVRAIAARHGVPVPEETWLPPGGDALPDGYPALIKPARGDGSFGITQQAVVATPEEARDYVAFLRQLVPDRALLAQEFLPGREYGVGLIGNPGSGFTLLPPLEVDYGLLPEGLPPILSYESKTVPDSPYWTDIRYRQAPLDEETRERLRRASETLFALLGCRDYARFDFRADAAGEIKLLEVNPNPAWCWDGKLALMAGFADIPYPQLLAMILEAAQVRAAATPPTGGAS